jgi:hypothetical protein
MKEYKISEELLQKVYNYLGTCAAAQVVDLIIAIREVVNHPVEESDE